MPDVTTGGVVQVVGLADLRRACAIAGNQMSRDMNDALKAAGEPVRSDAQSLAVANISKVGIPWSRMRLGIQRHSVYVAPVERGEKSRTRHGRRRPKFKTKLLDEAMAPALERNSDRVAQEFQDAVRDMGRAWARV
jgi:hypothetical protein